MDKSLKERAIKYNGKDYVQVKDRIEFFNSTYDNGSIRTEVIKDEGDIVQIKATVIPDMTNLDKYFNGHAEEIRGQGYVNKTSALENCETSAVGRALAMMGIGVMDAIASMDEIDLAKGKAIKQDNNPFWKKAKEAEENFIDMVNIDDGYDDSNDPPTPEQLDEIKVLAGLIGTSGAALETKMKLIKTREQARRSIAKLRSQQ